MTQTKGPVFAVEDKAAFRENFDRKSFMVPHNLADNPLFEFDRLFALVKTKADRGEIYWDMGDIKINTKWKDTPAKNLSAAEAFERIENANAWLLLRAVHNDPDYLAILESCMAQVEELSGVDFKRYVKLKDSIIFITSPRRISTYHIDRECSMLLQIRGDKTIHVFDRKDREVLPEEEIERFWTVDNNAPRYKEQYQNRATTYLLTPGQAVHIPVNDPHWLQNGDGVSISLNVNFHYHDFMRADLYRANYALRRLGLSPIPPGQSTVREAIKRVVVGKPISLVKDLKGKISKK
jgi:hypothetical protein